MQKIYEKISNLLELPYKGDEQDWDIEMADPLRVDVFIDFYKKNRLTEFEKKEIMSLIFVSIDELLDLDKEKANLFMEEVVILINQDRDLFEDLLNYWKLDPKNSNNQFKLSYLVNKFFFDHLSNIDKL